MKYRVYYMKPEHFRDGICGLKRPSPATLDATHIFLREVEAKTLEDVFTLSQGEIWSPNGEARDLIQSKGLGHTSMSVGDVVIDGNDPRWAWVVASTGFVGLGPYGRSITVGSITPWGTADYVDIKDNGVVWLSTPGHGGFYLGPELNEAIPAAWRAASFNGQGENGWYEEDCDWCMVALTYSDLFNATDLAAARSTFDHWIKPKLKEAVT